MTDLSKLKQEINDLIQKGTTLFNDLAYDDENKECKDLSHFLVEYEIWYTKCQPIIKQLAPERYIDFTNLYSNQKRKEITENNYCIEDALNNVDHLGDFMTIVGPWTASNCVLRQVSMLKACADNLEGIAFNIKGIFQADIFDSELDSARHLLKNGYLRSAGMICGIVLEKHFAEVCKNHNIVITKKDPCISDYNGKLKDIVYDTIEWRKIQSLADIRNLCDHSKGRDPDADEIEDLIKGTAKIIKTIF